MMDGNAVRELRGRVRELLDLHARSSLSGHSAGDALGELCDIARVALIGGAIRDLYYLPVESFKSDLDFVVEVRDAAAFRLYIDRYNARRNRFGGYKIQIGNIQLDFWEHDKSWAHVAGYKNVSCAEDVVWATFFNVDSVLYFLEEDKVFAKEGFADWLQYRYLDINLAPNPNPAGCAIRALRRLCEYNMVASPMLTTYIASVMDKVGGWESLLKIDENAYPERTSLRSYLLMSPRSGDEFKGIVARHDGRVPCKVDQAMVG